MTKGRRKEQPEWKRRIAEREQRSAEKLEAAAEERQVVALPAARNRPAAVDGRFDARVRDVVRKHGDRLLFNHRARPNFRKKGKKNDATSGYNLVGRDGQKWKVSLYQINLGRFDTELEAAWFAQLLMEDRGHPQACRNFDANGEPCFDYEAFLAQFNKPFTSATPLVYLDSYSGMLRGVKRVKGTSGWESVHAAPGVDDATVAADLQRRLADRAE